MLEYLDALDYPLPELIKKLNNTLSDRVIQIMQKQNSISLPNLQLKIWNVPFLAKSTMDSFSELSNLKFQWPAMWITL